MLTTTRTPSHHCKTCKTMLQQGFSRNHCKVAIKFVIKTQHRQHGNGDKGAYNDDDRPFAM